LLDGDLQRLYYDLGDMHTPYPNIKEDIEFTKLLIVKQKLEIFPKSETELICFAWALEINTF
jgi:hypothetical protein